MGLTDRVKARAKHPTGGAVTGRLAAHDPRNNARVNSVADRVGHGKGVKGTSIEDARSHHSAPLSTLQDPAAFGAPPKHINYHTEGAVEATSSPVRANPPALPSSSKPAPPKPTPRVTTSGGLGAPLPKSTILSKEEQAQRAAEEAANAPPPVPYRTDTTGLSTDGLPKPPVRRVNSEDSDAQVRPRPARRLERPKPQPPPRLPARQNSNPTEFTPSPPPTYSVATEPEQQPIQPAAPTSMNQLSELQSRFNRLPGRVSSPPAQPPRPTESPTTTSPTSQDAPPGGTTWAQKQAAMRTASQFNQDPSSVSASDAIAAGNTARDFQQRHGEQVASGWQRAKAMDSKYNVRGKVGGFVQEHGQTAAQQPPAAASADEGHGYSPSSITAAAASKKAPPPPPPPKKRELQGAATSGGGAGTHEPPPPPVPLSSKPTF